MKLQEKFTLYNAVTKIILVVVLGIIIMFSIEKISVKHLDNRLLKKEAKLIENLNDQEIDSLLNAEKTFTDYNILKDEFIVLHELPNAKNTKNTNYFTTEDREIKGDIDTYRILAKEFNYKRKIYKLEIGLTLASVISIKNVLGLSMLIVLVVSIFITLITDYTFTRFLLKPFYKIIDQKINKVNDPITFNYNQIKTSTADFVLLDNSINGLMRKLTDLFLLEKQFIANVSHELLTPISILNTRLENILASEELNENHEEKILSSLKTLSKLKAIINSLLLISKVENNQFPKADKINFKNEIDEIYDDLTERFTAKNISFSNLVDHQIIFTGNKTLIHILLTNIINNAIKYGNKNGFVAITSKVNTNGFSINIADNGIGMAPETINKAFYRFERETNNEISGLGLGLAIANSIAKSHELNIQITSAKKQGTAVEISFKAQSIK